MTQARAEDPDRAVAVAQQYLEARSYTRAQEILRSALTISPHHAGLLTELARTQMYLGDQRGAADTAYAAMGRAPQDTYPMRVYALALAGLNRHDDALAVAWRAVHTDPQGVANHHVYAALLCEAGRAHQALPVIVEALRRNPADADLHVAHGRILRGLGRREESTGAFREALRLEPESSDALHDIAVNRINRGRWFSGVHGLMAAARLDPAVGDLARSNIVVAVRTPLRLLTGFAAVLLIFASLAVIPQYEGQSVPGIRIAVGLAAVGYVLLLVWVGRRLPRQAWRLAWRARRFFAVRIVVLTVCGMYALLGAAGVLVPVLTWATFWLMCAVLVVIVVGLIVRG